MVSRSASLARWLPAALCALLLAGCGGAQQRPALVSTFPANLDVLPGPLARIRLDFDEPVTILNPNAALVVADGLQVPITSFQLPGEPSTVYLLPVVGAAFLPGRRHFVRVIEGLAVNGEQHFALDPVGFSFDLGPEPPIAGGAPQEVRLFDRDTLVLIDRVPTPAAAADVVVGVLTTETAAGPRFWAQRSDPGAGTTSLAFFDLGDAAMTGIPLTTSGPGSTLVASGAALALGPAGRFVYVAFRELPAGLVRLAKVDADTGTEVDSLVLSPVPGPATAPTGLAVSLDRAELAVACAEGAAGRMVFVDLATFAEIDRDPAAVGTQGVPLPHPPGEVEAFNTRYITTALDGTGTVNAQQVLTGGFTVLQTPSTTSGTGVHALRTLDQVFSIQTVAGYTGGEALVTRQSTTAYTAAAAHVVSDDVGGTPTNTSGVMAAQRSGALNIFVLLHDGGIVTRWIWNGIDFAQEDLDPNTDGVQALDGGADWIGVVTLAREAGRFPP